MTLAPTVIPVAAGKGGVGKSFVTANLAMALAAMGHRTIAMDLDLGGSNLYSFLGLPNRHPGLADFLMSRSAELAQLAVPTGVDNLRYIPGDGKTPFMGNLHSARKQKLLRHIAKLEADYILLDLGAGTSFNTLDFFAASERGILVTTVDQLSIMNLLVFMKGFLLRRVDRTLAGNRPLKGLLKKLWNGATADQIPTVKELVRRIAKEDRQAAEAVRREILRYRPRVVFNMGTDPEEMAIAEPVNRSLASMLSLTVDYFGYLPEDDDVREAVRSRRPYLPVTPDGKAAVHLQRLAERTVKYWHHNIDDSANRLIQSERQTVQS